jgi:recombination protein RecA
VRLDIRRTGSIKKGEDVIGNETKVKVVKNKVAPPFKQAEFEIIYNEGISRLGEVIDLGVKAGLIEKAGAWYSHEGTRIGQGKENVRNYLKEHTDLAQSLETRIRAHYLAKPETIPEAEVETATQVEDEAEELSLG